MASRIRHVTVDAQDPARVARFWRDALGYVEPEDDPIVDGADEALVVDPSGQHPGVLFIAVPEPKLVKNRVHLDLQPRAAGRDATVDELLALGARLVADHRSEDGTGWAVLADPEGNEFCVERSAAERASASGDRDGEAAPDAARPMAFGRTSPERELLENLLEWYRAGVLQKVEGLGDEQARQRHVASESTIVGIVNHLALVEDSWFTGRFDGQPLGEPWSSVDWDADPDFEFRTARDEPLQVVVERYRAACDRSRRVAAAASLDTEAAHFSPTTGPFSLRWAMLHLLEETARHLGHLDVLRELTDGRVGD